MAALDGSVKALFELPDAMKGKMLAVDPEHLTKNDTQNKEWWDRVFKA